ncbi:MAG: hypothetical protein ACI4KF_12335 [Huintestinicola sp.]
MKKEDLKVGYLVELSSKERFFVMPYIGGMCLVNETLSIPMSMYNDNLRSISGNAEDDIYKVYDIASVPQGICSLSALEYRKTLWSRQEENKAENIDTPSVDQDTPTQKQEAANICGCCQSRDLLAGFGYGGNDSFLDVIMDPGDNDNPSLDIRLWDNDKKDYVIDASIEIHYCPICGRKLGEERENGRETSRNS